MINWLLQDPETVARAVILCSQRWVRSIPLGLQGKATLAVGALAPRLVDLLSGFIVRLVEKGGRWESPVDNLFETRSAATICAVPVGALTTIPRLI